MSEYCFRSRFKLSPRCRLNIDSEKFVFTDIINNNKIEIISNEKKEIKNSEELLLYSSGYSSESEAKEYGLEYLLLLQRIFSVLIIGADFGRWS